MSKTSENMSESLKDDAFSSPGRHSLVEDARVTFDVLTVPKLLFSGLRSVPHLVLRMIPRPALAKGTGTGFGYCVAVGHWTGSGCDPEVEDPRFNGNSQHVTKRRVGETTTSQSEVEGQKVMTCFLKGSRVKASMFVTSVKLITPDHHMRRSSLNHANSKPSSYFFSAGTR